MIFPLKRVIFHSDVNVYQRGILMMLPEINYTSSILFNISVCGKLILPIVPLINITNIDDRYGSEVQFPTNIIDELRIVPD